jgi:hypothetical protein
MLLSRQRSEQHIAFLREKRLTRSSHRWQSKPGGYDAVHALEVFPSDGNSYGIPTVRRAPIAYLPTWIVPYRTRLRGDTSVAEGAFHFFLDDYRFEAVWNHPNKALHALSTHHMTALTPDFSVFADWPIAIQIWNTYRNRWCGAMWQANGIRVIPSIAWSTPESYPFAFAGVEQRSLVAVSTVGIRQGDFSFFARGYREMLIRLRPSHILCYGRLDSELEKLAEVRVYPSRWELIKRAGAG